MDAWENARQRMGFDNVARPTATPATEATAPKGLALSDMVLPVVRGEPEANMTAVSASMPGGMRDGLQRLLAETEKATGTAAIPARQSTPNTDAIIRANMRKAAEGPSIGEAPAATGAPIQQVGSVQQAAGLNPLSQGAGGVNPAAAAVNGIMTAAIDPGAGQPVRNVGGHRVTLRYLGQHSCPVDAAGYQVSARRPIISVPIETARILLDSGMFTQER